MLSFTSQWIITVPEQQLNNKTMQKRLNELVKASPGGPSRSIRSGKNYHEAYINVPDSKDNDVIGLVNKYSLVDARIGEYDPDLKEENVKRKPPSSITWGTITPKHIAAYNIATRSTENKGEK